MSSWLLSFEIDDWANDTLSDPLFTQDMQVGFVRRKSSKANAVLIGRSGKLWLTCIEAEEHLLDVGLDTAQCLMQVESLLIKMKSKSW